MCPTQRKTCEVSYKLGCEGSYCYKVSEVKLTNVGKKIPSDYVLFCYEIQFVNSHTFYCKWRSINMDTCAGPSSFHSDSCRNCINLCWDVYSANYTRTLNESKPETGRCQSPTAIPTAATQTAQTATTTGLCQTTVSTAPEAFESPASKSAEVPATTTTTRVNLSLIPSTITVSSTPAVSTATEVLSSVLSTATAVSISAPSTTSYVISSTVSTATNVPCQTASVTSSLVTVTGVYTTSGSVNMGDSVAATGDGPGNVGVFIGVGSACAILIALVLASGLIFYRRRKQRRDKEEAEKRRISYIQPYALSGQDYDGGAHTNNNLFSSFAGDQFDFAKDEHDYRTYDALGNTYTNIAEGAVAHLGPFDKSKSDIDDYEFVNEGNFLKSEYKNVEGRVVYARACGGTMGDNTYNKLNNGISGSKLDFLDNMPETYNMAPTGEIGIGEGGKGHNRLRGGAGLSKESVRGDDLEMYRMASEKELDTVPREEKEEAGHVYNRLRDGAGTSKGVMKRDLGTYNVAAGKIQPDSENQTEKVVSNNSAEPVNPYSVASIIDNEPVVSSLEVKDEGDGWVSKEDRNDEGQGLFPSDKPGSGFTDSEDSRDPESTEYFVLEDDKQRYTGDKAGATTQGLETSPEKQSTEYFLLGDSTDTGAARELTDTSLGDHTQTEYFMLEEKEGNVNGIARSSSLSVDGEKNLYFLTENEHKETEYFALEDEAKQANGDVGNHNLPKDGLGNLYFLTDNEQEETEYSLAEEDVVKDGVYDLHQGQPMDGLVSFDLNRDGSDLEGDYFMVDVDVGTHNKLYGSDADNNSDRREGGARGNGDSGIRISHVYNEIPGDEDETEYMEINDVVKYNEMGSAHCDSIFLNNT